MTIGAHISGKNAAGSYLFNSLQILSAQYPDDHFIFFTESVLPTLNKNCTPVLISPQPKNKLILYYWYSYKLPALLKRYNADAFISDAGMLPAESETNQYLFIDNDEFEKGRNRFFKKILINSLHKAECIFTTEHFIKEYISQHFSIASEKIKDVKHGITKSPAEYSFIEAERIKKHFTDDCDYFLCYVSAEAVQHLTCLLKAYSQLKRRQRSSMKMLLLLKKNIDQKNLIPDFKNYKYRDDVKVISEDDKDSSLLINYAFAMIWLCKYADASIVFSAMQANVPVIAEDTGINKKLFSDAVLITEISELGLSEKIQLLYKDEHKKNTLTEKANVFLQNYNAEDAAHALRNGIVE